jgi:hypothetical protein
MIMITIFIQSNAIAKHTKVDMIWVAGRSPTLVSQNLKATTLTYLAIYPVVQGMDGRQSVALWGNRGMLFPESLIS